jgi:segregation and condensation protein B
MLAELLELPVERVEALCSELSAAYEAEERGFVLARVAGGYRFQSHEAYAGFVERFVTESLSPRLSAAALETLAVIAYRQPISRAQVAAIRGVNVDGVVRLLTQRGYVAPAGRDPGPGQAVLYGTTPLFLEQLGLDHLGELPPLADFVPGPNVVEALERGLRDGLDPRSRANGGSALEADQAEGDLIDADLTDAEQAELDLAEPEQADSEAEQAQTEQAQTEQAQTEQAQTEGTEADQDAPEQNDGHGDPSADRSGQDGSGR